MRLPSRRTFLRVGVGGVLAALAGCLNRSSPAGSPSASETPSASPTADTTSSDPTTGSETPYPDRTVDFPDGPKSRPTRPESLTESSVREFVATHEYRYVYNSLWMGEGTEVSLECDVERVAPEGEGYVADVTCTGSANAGGGRSEEGTGTATAVHADYFTQTYRYYVDSESLLRYRVDDE